MIKQLSLLLKIPCLSVAKNKKNRGSEALKAKKAVLLLLFPTTYKRRKFFRVKKNSQNLEPSPHQPQRKHNCPSLLTTIVFYPSEVTLKSFQPKVGNRYILSFQPKVGNRYIYDDKVFCFHKHIFLYFSVTHAFPLCWKSWSFLLVILLEHQ